MNDAKNIRERMDVFGSCGNRLGSVDRVEANSIKLRKDDPDSCGEHHYIPLDWVETVDNAVRLNKDCGEAREEWQAAPLGAGGG